MVDLYTTLEQFEHLHERNDRTRSTSKTVTVDRQALINILMDHSSLVLRFNNERRLNRNSQAA